MAHALQPWQSIYSSSKVVATVVTSLHISALLFGGGLAVAADRTTLRALGWDGDARGRALDELDVVHKPVLLAISLSFITGILLATADIETFAKSPYFWVKLSLVALLLLNGVFLRTTERAARTAVAAGGTGDELYARLRITSWLSITLWTAVLFAGVALTNAA
ncbi:MAG: hypothetical protein M3081_06050 [Gemmatimonadota bacterium]|nr:hypothetical protein [Gemmatimonadota bacterium]